MTAGAFGHVRTIRVYLLLNLPTDVDDARDLRTPCKISLVLHGFRGEAGCKLLRIIMGAAGHPTCRFHGAS